MDILPAAFSSVYGLTNAGNAGSRRKQVPASILPGLRDTGLLNSTSSRSRMRVVALSVPCRTGYAYRLRVRIGLRIHSL